MTGAVAGLIRFLRRNIVARALGVMVAWAGILTLALFVLITLVATGSPWLLLITFVIYIPCATFLFIIGIMVIRRPELFTQAKEEEAEA